VRIETDSLGAVEVPDHAYWGAQTQRSIGNFPIGDPAAERMPLPLIHALGLVKQAAARVNRAHGLDGRLADAIEAAASEVATGALDDQFPLIVWQTGSGTQSNMNVNEVVAGRANEMLTGVRGGKSPVHPNDHVNMGQSSNDSFPTAMHIAVALELRNRLLASLRALAATFRAQEAGWGHIVKIGRTHMMDATPVTLGQEVSAWAQTCEDGAARVVGLWPRLSRLAQGGTAVGTGLNAPPSFGEAFCAALAEMTGGVPWASAPNKFEALGTHDTLVEVAGVLTTIATGCMKIGNDVRLLGSGPRAGLGELALPENEPGSSIMPGKVNPTQAEALTMVCAQVIGNGTAVTVGGLQGHLQLNVFKPLIAHNVLRSIRLLADAIDSFRLRCVEGMVPNEARIAELVERSLMLVTALAPEIGYDRAAAIAKLAHAEGLTLLEAGLKLGHVTEAQFRAAVQPEKMV
jgi:fumarate hydratase class II